MKKVGTVVNTHGIKGEIRIMSGGHFSNNDFLKDFTTITIEDKEYIIEKYRKHKKFHQVFLKGFNNINDVEFLKGKSVFVNQVDDNFDLDELISRPVYLQDKEIGKVKSISYTKLYKIFNLDSGQAIPINDNFIIKITKEKIEVKNI